MVILVAEILFCCNAARLVFLTYTPDRHGCGYIHETLSSLLVQSIERPTVNPEMVG